MNKSQQNKLLRSVERKFGRTRSSTWKNKDFEDLSFAIHQETKILISVATLKRLFKKVKTNDDYSPQEGTAQALISYSGYKESKSSPWNKKLIVVILVLLAFSVWLLLRLTQTGPNSIVAGGHLGLIKTEGKSPTTAFFELQIPNAKKPVFIDFGDNQLSKPLTVEDKLATHFYASPGYFNVRMHSDNVTIASLPVLIPTDGWKALSYYFKEDHEEKPEEEENVVVDERYYPLPLATNITNQGFHASTKSIATAGIDTNKIIVVRLDNYRKTGMQGDTFHYKTRFNNATFWPGVRCHSVYVRITGTQGIIEFKLVGEGCSIYGEYTLGEKHVRGLKDDLSQLVVDTRKWINLEMTNSDKQVIIKINNTEVFTESYKQSIGEIVGTSLIFHGSGTVDYIELTTTDDQLVFGTNF